MNRILTICSLAALMMYASGSAGVVMKYKTTTENFGVLASTTTVTSQIKGDKCRVDTEMDMPMMGDMGQQMPQMYQLLDLDAKTMTVLFPDDSSKMEMSFDEMLESAKEMAAQASAQGAFPEMTWEVQSTRDTSGKVGDFDCQGRIIDMIGTAVANPGMSLPFSMLIWKTQLPEKYGELSAYNKKMSAMVGDEMMSENSSITSMLATFGIDSKLVDLAFMPDGMMVKSVLTITMPIGPGMMGMSDEDADDEVADDEPAQAGDMPDLNDPNAAGFDDSAAQAAVGQMQQNAMTRNQSKMVITTEISDIQVKDIADDALKVPEYYKEQ